MTKKIISVIADSSIIIKKGRKPKGGKLVQPPIEKVEKYNQITNIILHLKCNSSDLNAYNNDFNKFIVNPLEYDPRVPQDIQSYSSNELYTLYEKKNETSDANLHLFENECSISHDSANDIDMTIDNKLRRLKIDLYKNELPHKKSSCFWCTYEYDNPSCYIPKYEMDGTMFAYGSFCRPECAVAHLMRENIDDSTKFERFHLLNHVYGSVYNYKVSIKPAPNPYYLLDKFYGNLTIQEYRQLLKSEHFLQVIEKPLTRILPELHDDNQENIENFYGSDTLTSNNKNMGMYKVKRKTDKQTGPIKSVLLREHFGLT